MVLVIITRSDTLNSKIKNGDIICHHQREGKRRKVSEYVTVEGMTGSDNTIERLKQKTNQREMALVAMVLYKTAVCFRKP